METIPVDAVSARFWAKVEKTDTCWNWTAAKTHGGYGVFKLHGAMVRVHRLSAAMAGQDVRRGMEVDHICHNRACVRPDHLRVVTRKQNMENHGGRPQGNSKSGIRGVSRHKPSGKWQAQVEHHGVNHHLGLFADIAEAEAAVIALRNKLFTHNDADRARELQEAR